MPANPTDLSFYGVAKEATVGTYVAPADYLPLNKFDPQDMTTWLIDSAARGSMVDTYNKVAGPVWSEISCGGPVFPDTIGYPVMGILGDITTTGASAPFTHAGAVKNSSTGQPTSHSLFDYDAVDSRGYTGIQWYDLTFTWDGEKYLNWDGTARGFQSATQSKPSASYTSVAMLPGWLSAVTINSIASTTLIDAEIKIARQGGPIHTADGTQAPYQIFLGGMGVSGKFVVVADTNTQLTNYLAGTKVPLDFNFQQGAGAAAVQVKFHMSNVNYDLAKPVRNKQWVEYEITYEAVANATDAGASGGQSPIKVTLQNAKPAATYI